MSPSLKLGQPRKLMLIGPTAMRTFRCVWMLEELRVEYEHDFVSMPWSAKALQFHPMGKVPALSVQFESRKEPFVLYESAAINTFLGTLFGREDLVPRGHGGGSGRDGTINEVDEMALKRAEYDQTISCLLSEIDSQALWIHRKHESLGHVFGASEVAVDQAREQFHRAHAALVQRLNPYLLGQSFTAADILFIHCLDWAEMIGWLDLSSSPPPSLTTSGGSSSSSNGNAGPKPDEEQKDGGTSMSDTKLQAYLTLCRSRPAYKAAVAKRKKEKEYAKAQKAKKENSTGSGGNNSTDSNDRSKM